MAGYVAAIDQGTTSTRCMIFDHTGSEVGRHQLEHEQILPRAGWVEHDAGEIWQRAGEVVQGALRASELTAADLAALGITNQRETTVVWNPKTVSRTATPSSGRTPARPRSPPISSGPGTPS